MNRVHDAAHNLYSMCQRTGSQRSCRRLGVMLSLGVSSKIRRAAAFSRLVLTLLRIIIRVIVVPTLLAAYQLKLSYSLDITTAKTSRSVTSVPTCRRIVAGGESRLLQLQCYVSPLVSDSISYIKCPSPSAKKNEKLILSPHPPSNAKI